MAHRLAISFFYFYWFVRAVAFRLHNDHYNYNNGQ